VGEFPTTLYSKEKRYVQPTGGTYRVEEEREMI